MLIFGRSDGYFTNWSHSGNSFNFFADFMPSKVYLFGEGIKQRRMVRKWKLKGAIILEELVELTGDYKLAIVLNLLIFVDTVCERFRWFHGRREKRDYSREWK